MAAETFLARQAQAVAERQAIPALLTKALIRRNYLPVGERTLDRWISSGTFPRPDIAIGGKVRYWKRETVEAWIDAQAEGAAR
jgi:predicted DNA-binding transcriptional regulator AlpA